MLKLILFYVMENITTLRGMEKAAKNDIRIMWLTDELKPSHQTINQFMNERLKGSIEDIFHEINRYIIKKEQIDVQKIYIDWTKIEANVNKYTFVWKGSIEKFREKLYRKITKQLEKMNERYQEKGIFFPVEETYEIETLMKIVQYLEEEIKQGTVSFVYGKGQRKTALQRDYEKGKKGLNVQKIIKSSFRYSPLFLSFNHNHKWCVNAILYLIGKAYIICI